MIKLRKGLAALALWLAVSALASPSHAQEATVKSAPNVRRPFTSAAFWRTNIRSTTGATWKFISTEPV